MPWAAQPESGRMHLPSRPPDFQNSAGPGIQTDDLQWDSASCMTLGKSLYLSEPQFPHLKRGSIKKMTSQGFCGDSVDIR